MDSSPSIMIDDVSVEPTTGIGPNLTATVGRLAQFRISRQKAHIWAHRHVKFLASDETDVDQADELMNDESSLDQADSQLTIKDPGDSGRTVRILGGNEDTGYDRESSDAVLARAIALSLGSYPNEVPDPNANLPDPNADQAASSSSKGISKDKNPAVDDQEDISNCASCQAFAEFPRHRKARRFRLVKPRSTCPNNLGGPGCGHFVCVSYCWPKDKDGRPVERPKTKTITMLDGSERPNRAPDDILDRAVDVARSYGLRMIWIDQECLPQDKSEEQQLGVQAMDVLYNRAAITAGLLDSAAISTQAQMDAIHTVSRFYMHPSGRKYSWLGDGPPPVINEETRNLVLDFFEMMNNDAYYTRAWIVQEALSAGDKLVLVLPKGKGVQELPRVKPNIVESIMRLTDNRLPKPDHALIHVCQFRDIVEGAKGFFTPNM